MKAILLTLAAVPLLLTGCVSSGGYYSDYPGYYDGPVYYDQPVVGFGYYDRGYHGYHHAGGYVHNADYHGGTHVTHVSGGGFSHAGTTHVGSGSHSGGHSGGHGHH